MPRLAALPLFLLGNTQFIVSLATAVLLLHLHSPHAIYFGIGTLVSAASAKFLKLFIRQARPTRGGTGAKKTYGMPSTHSSAIAFFGTYLSLISLSLPFHPRLPFLGFFARLVGSEDALRYAMAAVWIGGAASVCWSRVRLGHHTRAQVFVGAALGATVATVWLAGWMGTDASLGMGRYEGIGGEVVREGLRYQAVGLEEQVAIAHQMYKDSGWKGLRQMGSLRRS